ncbi:MAG: MFS transporter [Proteobacteria bacterium]|jgi:NNP family nitrate/nitrite transporter-like MFS transporter|nr:MFS transporter [Desulfocapsa sp.]MBU3945889.1 MFS transporter [Pseudomonadota bacterium]MCG2745586.1 MFS transporter [Desulfobacteraceae bacterium]MBU4027736.1 MFS transporter [Pseudomonadota bacterium]MBU4042593.1 MFS transporter [Pseudomonadota bacterium]
MHCQTFSKVISSLLFLAGLFFLNFTSRVIFSPLLPIIEGEFGLGHAEAGSFFLLISGGYFFSILSSGFVSARINHKNTIALSTIASGITLIALSYCSTLFWMRIGLFCLGLSAGLYLPSGLASIKRLVEPAYLARGMAVHELAPNLGYIAAPVLADLMIISSSWQQGLMWLGICMAGAGLVYGIAGRGSHERGKSLDILSAQNILSRPEFWLLVLLFSLAICSSLGVYAMLPLFLVSEQGMTPERASHFLAFSRIAALMMPLLAGWYGDRVGNRTIMAFVLLIAGLCTVLLGLVSSFSWLVLLVILQPVFAVCFFPSGFAVLSALGVEGEGALAVSLCIPAAFLLGGGVFPVLIGLIGDHASIGVGFMVAGTAMMAGATLSFFVSFVKK